MIKQLTSSQDICDAIEKQQMLANFNTSRHNILQKATTKIHKEQQKKAIDIPLQIPQVIKIFICLTNKLK